MQNKLAGFWPRFAARLFDIVLVAAIVTGLAFALMDPVTLRPTVDVIKNGVTTAVPKDVHAWEFIGPWAFYVWGFSFMALLFISGIGIPILTKGSSLGQLLFRIKVVSKDGNLIKGIFKREIFFTWTWMFTTLMAIAFINHTLIDEFSRTDKYGVTFDSMQTVRIGIVTAVGSIAILIQMVVGISGLVRADKRGLHDVFANTLTVWKNKYTNTPQEAKRETTKPKPESAQNVTVDWI